MTKQIESGDSSVPQARDIELTDAMVEEAAWELLDWIGGGRGDNELFDNAKSGARRIIIAALKRL